MTEVKRTAIVDKDGGNKLASVVQSLSDPTKNGLVIVNPDGTLVGEGKYMKLDQTVQETVTGGPKMDFLQLNTLFADGSNEGRLQWNSTEGCLEVGMPGGNANLQIGLEMYVPRRCINDTGADIPNGKLVYLSDFQGNNPYISLADCSTDSESRVIGMTTETIADGQRGWVTTYGIVRDVDTDGLSTNAILYLGTNGDYTTVKPVAPNFVVRIGSVWRVSATEGEILIGIDRRSNSYTNIHGLTAGSIPFADQYGFLTEDANLSWNNTTKTLTLKPSAGNVPVLEMLEPDGTSDGMEFRTGPSDCRSHYIGYNAGANHTDGSVNNTAFGYQAMDAVLNGANNNIAFGCYALTKLTSGSYNAALGVNCLANLTSGSGNLAQGFGALYNITTQSTNVAFGAYAGYLLGGYSNVAIGSYALGRIVGAVSTACNYNVAIGANAGLEITEGDANIVIGYSTGDNITTGSRNIMIGYAIDAPVADGNYQLSIGNLIYGTGLSSTGTTVSTGLIGIGKIPAVEKLELAGNFKIFDSTATENRFYFEAGNASSHARMTIYDNAQNADIIFDASTTNVSYINAGNVGIGNTNPYAKLHITKSALTYATPTYFTTNSFIIEDAEGTMEFVADDTGNYGASLLLSNISTIDGSRKAWGILNKAVISNNRFAISYGTTNNINDYGSTAEKLVITTAGNVGIGTVSPSEKLHVVGNIFIDTDSNKLILGAGKDMGIKYDGTNGYIDTSLVAASDLHITTGTAKTIVYDTPVYEDLNFDPTRSGGPAATRPDDVTINNVIHKEFTSLNNQICGAVAELPHKYKLSSDLAPHMHIFLKSGESSGTTGVTFTFYWELRQSTGITSGSVSLSATSAQLAGTSGGYKLDLYDSSFTGAAELGAQLACTIARTGGDAGDIVVTSYGIHHQVDTPGSRTISSK